MYFIFFLQALIITMGLLLNNNNMISNNNMMMNNNMSLASQIHLITGFATVNDINNIYKDILNNYKDIMDKYSMKLYKDNNNNLPKMLEDFTEEEKGYYLSGLFEGDGNIYTRTFSIVFSIEDAPLAHYLCQYFKMGYIDYKNNSPPASAPRAGRTKKELTVVKWNIMKESEQRIFTNYINGKLLTYKRYDQYYKYNFDKKLNILLMKPMEFNVLLNPWLMGFTDADGYFYSGLSNKLTIVMKYELSQKESYILDIIKKYSNTGTVYKRDFKSGTYAHIYTVTSNIGMKPFIEYFNKYKPLSIRRYRQYLLLNITYLLRINKMQSMSNIKPMFIDLTYFSKTLLMSSNMKNKQLNNAMIIINYYRKLRNLNEK
ncbi:cox1-I4-orf372.CDS.1 (mitochondrion) [Saccharomyces cerevisiae]|nr:cox1-I4-orf372.CDS.1 [Saccharomyces cerevisiae]